MCFALPTRVWGAPASPHQELGLSGTQSACPLQPKGKLKAAMQSAKAGCRANRKDHMTNEPSTGSCGRRGARPSARAERTRRSSAARASSVSRSPGSWAPSASSGSWAPSASSSPDICAQPPQRLFQVLAGLQASMEHTALCQCYLQTWHRASHFSDMGQARLQ